MRSILLSALILITPTLTASLIAQDMNEIETLRNKVLVQRRLAVDTALRLTDEEGQAFWPVYKKYHNEMNKIGDSAVELMQRYMQSWQNLPDEIALQTLEEYLTVQQKRMDLKRKFVRDFKKVLTPTKLLRYYQVEERVDRLYDTELSKGIPLVVE